MLGYIRNAETLTANKGPTMKRSYRKDDIETHSDRGPARPAVNVKSYRQNWTTDTIEAHFDCEESVAEKAAEYAFTMACEVFWEDVQEAADHHLGAGYKVWQEGRSGGWLVVDGLPDIDSWDAILVSKWGRFEKSVRAEVDYRLSWDVIREDIEANEWAKPYAEQYNFIDTPKGTVCVADIEAAAAKAAQAAREAFIAGATE